MTVAARDREDVLTEGVCAYCGHVSACLEVEHTFPRSRGGSDELFNLVAACYLCNSEKLARTPAEWRADREAAGLPWPPPSIRQTRQTFQDEVVRIDPEAFEHAEEAWSLREMYEDLVASRRVMEAIRRGKTTAERAARDWYTRLIMGSRPQLTKADREFFNHHYSELLTGGDGR